MIVCVKFGRKNGRLDLDAVDKVAAYREADVLEVSRENKGQVLVRLDNGEPAEYWDSVEDGETAISSGDLIEAWARKSLKGANAGRAAKC